MKVTCWNLSFPLNWGKGNLNEVPWLDSQHLQVGAEYVHHHYASQKTHICNVNRCDIRGYIKKENKNEKCVFNVVSLQYTVLTNAVMDFPPVNYFSIFIRKMNKPRNTITDR